jgi:hypothetical protein
MTGGMPIQDVSNNYFEDKKILKKMFTDTPPDIRLEKLLNIYNQLDGSLRDCLVEQSGILLKLQRDKQ